MTCELWHTVLAFVIGGMAGVFAMCLMAMASRANEHDLDHP